MLDGRGDVSRDAPRVALVYVITNRHAPPLRAQTYSCYGYAKLTDGHEMLVRYWSSQTMGPFSEQDVFIRRWFIVYRL